MLADNDFSNVASDWLAAVVTTARTSYLTNIDFNMEMD